MTDRTQVTRSINSGGHLRFPERVWQQAEGAGWSSRPATENDIVGRAERRRQLSREPNYERVIAGIDRKASPQQKVAAWTVCGQCDVKSQV